MKNNKGIYYALIFMILFIIFGLFEGAILFSTHLVSTSDKLFFSALNVMLCLGLPVGLITINGLTNNK